MGLGLIVCLFLGFVIYGFFAPLKVHHSTKLAPGQFSSGAVKVADKPFVGLALSGGGARAAVFASAGMHALAQRGLLDQITHVSSVSGGGLPASYWALNNMPACPRDACAAYFAAMQDAVADDYFARIRTNQIASPSRLLSPSRRLLSLQEALQERGFLKNGYGKDATISDLPSHRAFFFNAVSYDTGRRFVLSNLALPDPASGDASRLPAAIRALSFSDPKTMRPAPSDFPISLAVATSAAFPPYIGPITVQINDDAGKAKEYWHLGDGGLLENSGVETLREAIYARDSIAPATIFSFDAGQRLEPNLGLLDISVFSRDFVQLVDVLLTYASGHRETLAETLDAAQGVNIDLVTFNYLDLETMIGNPYLDPAERALWTSWDTWDQCSQSDHETGVTPVQRLRKIPTGFSISQCDEALIAAAAKSLVAQWKP